MYLKYKGLKANLCIILTPVFAQKQTGSFIIFLKKLYLKVLGPFISPIDIFNFAYIMKESKSQSDTLALLVTEVHLN